MLELESPIWKFALDFYHRPGVSDACLTLQDDANVDVIELLVVLFAGHGLCRDLSTDELAEMRRNVASWREMTVLPLREIRRALKPQRLEFPRHEKEILRAKVKSIELLAEQIQIAIAYQWLTNRPPAPVGLTLEGALETLLGVENFEECPQSCRDALVHIIMTVTSMDDGPR
ncbi:TIGR02444 family protein (plasmid) [Pseudohalocynthiibacter aestuariivivens]|nr:TIGR02444 family protein [Pseudohalocynthiibacter aestuariivivens]QIE48151.1 TIGR02444 family protein [Pseudohalocynthiibacter aestuariivivens]